MDINEILEYLPHRYPFLLVDRVLEIEPDKRIVALKNVTINEPFFPGHFPGHPVMPGVLIIEAMAQAAAILTFKSTATSSTGNSVYYFVGIDKARFKTPVVPGRPADARGRRIERTLPRHRQVHCRGTRRRRVSRRRSR